MATENTEHQTRILLWHAPRSGSSAFMRAIMNSTAAKVFMEPYMQAYCLGSERQSDRMKDKPIQGGATYADIKHTLEEPSPGYKTVFSKNSAFTVTDKVSTDYLPEGYQHTFLLRHPEKAVHSLYYHVCVRHTSGFSGFQPIEAGYKQLVEVYRYATVTLNQPSVVIDYEDLCNNPERVLPEYCSRVGLQFEKSMLNWKEEDKNRTEFVQWMPWFEDLFKTTRFQSGPSDTRKKYFPELATVPEVVHTTIQESIPYYEELLQHKIHFG